MSSKEGLARSFAPPPLRRADSPSAEARNTVVNGFPDQSQIAAVNNRLERLEQFAGQQARAWREPPPPAYRDNQPDYRDSQYDAAGPALLRARRSSPGINPWLFVMATALNTMVAAVLAVIITLGVVEGQSRETASASTGYTRVNTGYANANEGPRSASMQGLTVRPIGSPKEPLRLEARKPQRLPLQIEPESATNDPYIVVLGGAPTGTMLLGASRIGSDTWFLPAGAVSRLEITLPEWSSAPFEVAIELRRTDGLVAGQTMAWLAAPPPGGSEVAAVTTATTGMASDPSAVKDLLAQGSRLIERGEIVAARSVYQRAADMGSGDAALALASTYDPNRLWSLGAVGMVGNKERAKHWYTRANDLGHPEATARLRLLGN
jgi:hypothetical protein